MNRFLVILLLAAVSLLAAPGTLHAQLPYRTDYFERNLSMWMRIQPIYVPAAAAANGAQFTEPVDLQVGADDKVYVADKGAGKVVVLGNDSTPIRSIGAEEGPGRLSAPEGLFVTPEGIVYVADSGNQRIAVYGKDGSFIREYKKPLDASLKQEPFVPVKLVVDRRGVMYVALNSSYQGLMRLNADGEFMGYFGANKAQQTVLNWLKKLILNKEQLSKELANLPSPITNVALDRDGFIYTATAGSFGQGAIRKLNAGGVDTFKNKTLEHGQGIVDVAIDSDGFLYNVDLESARVNIYDRNGEALFSFGLVDNETQQYGVLGFPTSLGVDSQDGIWISDSRIGTVHKFVRTEFGSDVMKALALYIDGKYEQSKPYWERVFARNDMYNGTFQGLGKVYLHENKYDEALSFFKTSFDTQGYSNAFWEVRLEWLQRHFVWLAAAAAAVYLLWILVPRGIRKLFHDRRTLPPYWHQQLADLRNFGYVMIHPYQGFYRLKEARVSSWIIILILAVVLAVKVSSINSTGFLFYPAEKSHIDLIRSLGMFVLPWVTWIIANYLVCSVKDGEGKFREVVQGSTYALAPYLFFSVPITVLTNIVTLDERMIVDSLNSVMYLWMGVMFIVMTQVIHQFDFLETLKNTAITVFAIATIWLFAFIVFGLSYNLYDFFYQLYKEATF
jgi:tetratricopeptide (TPR) repeat protein